VLCCWLLGACASSAEGPETYVVRPDDTLYSIAWRHNLDYRDLARWNHIGGDFRISVGQVLSLGPSGEASPVNPQQRTAPGPVPAAGTQAGTPPAGTPQVGKPRPLADPTASASGKPAQGTRPGASAPAAAPAATPLVAPSAGGGAKWVWPTDRAAAPRPVPGGGILLTGRVGQDVRAASAGRVVYAGNGLRGYGNLIIIKHADAVLSAYAHNREMLVHDGQEVGTGQLIARMGEGPNKSPVLYFEIRQNGRPVDPLPYLPRAK
jgi:lipoprotein NlpD